MIEVEILMSYPFPPELGQLVQEGLATGAYASENDLLLEAVRALRERDDTVVGINEGLADLDQGRVRPLGEVDAALCNKYGILRDA
jgi:predicted transcriptional regulator